MISGNGQSWRADRKKTFNWYLNELKVGDCIASKDSEWEVSYQFINSKFPQYIVRHLGVKIFPANHASTPNKDEVLDFFLSQDPIESKNYFNHDDLKIIQNGCMLPKSKSFGHKDST